jgi:CRP/FNR family transcriptional regulator
MNDKLWQSHFSEFVGTADKVIKQLIDAAIVVNLPAR